MKVAKKAQLQKVVDLLNEGLKELNELHATLVAEQSAKSDKALYSLQGEEETYMIEEMQDIATELWVDVDALAKYLN